MLLAMLAATVLGSMPVPLHGAQKMDVSAATVLWSVPGAEWAWANLTIDASGKLVRCEIASSSGSKLLERVACERAVKVGRFSPAHDEEGQPVAAVVRQAFAVNRPLPPAAVDFALTVDRTPPGAVTDLRIVADSAGKVQTCAIDASSGVVQLDRLACGAITGVVRALVRDASGSPVRALSRVSVGFVSN